MAIGLTFSFSDIDLSKFFVFEESILFRVIPISHKLFEFDLVMFWPKRFHSFSYFKQQVERTADWRHVKIAEHHFLLFQICICQRGVNIILSTSILPGN